MLKKLPVVAQIQVTKNCNLDCRYCFQEHYGQIIAISTVEAILDKVITHNLQVDPQNHVIQVYWHGGEPLLAGIDFFESILDVERSYHHLTFNNRVQTNGTLMNDKLARFFAENSFEVGFSIDGPEDIHNTHRHFNQSGKGTFKSALEGLGRYRKYLSPGQRVSVIAVVTKNSISRASELFNFFKELKVDVQLDIYDLRTQDLCQPGNNLSPSTKFIPTPEEIGQFLIDLFELWFYDQDNKEDRISIKELKHELKMVLQPEIDHGDPFHKKRCDFRRLIFSPEGSVFSCDQWLNDEAMILGDIRTDPIALILEKKDRIWEEIKRVLRKSGAEMACSRCDWGKQCGGGCLTCIKYNAMLLQARAKGLEDDCWKDEILPPLWWSGTEGETYYCEGLRRFRRHIRKALKDQGL